MTSPSLERARRAAAHPLAVPVLMAVLICLCGAYVALSTAIPSWANDEAPHLGYVANLAHGYLPTIDSRIVDDPSRFPRGFAALLGWDDAHRDTWTANHPPLYHLMLVPIWWLTDGDLAHVVIAMRLVNTLGYGCWVLLAGLIARALAPGRPAVVALAAIITATPTLVLRAGFLQNDGWGCSAALLMMLMTIRMLRGGPDEVTTRRIAVAAVAGSLAAGTRAPGVLVVVVCCLTLLLCRRSERRGVLAAVVIGTVPALATGWFYVRNLRLYGDLTGQDALLEKFERVPLGGWTDIPRIPGLWEPLLAAWIPLAVLATVAPYIVVRRVVRRARNGALWSGWRPDPAWAMLVVHTVLTVGNLVGFLQAGGGFHDRYLMTSMPLIATAAALAMLSVRRPGLKAVGDPSQRSRQREWRVAAVWASVLILWLAGSVGYEVWFYVLRQSGWTPVQGPVPVALLVAAAAVGATVVGVVVRRATTAVVPRVTASDPVREAA
jgi:hypothetical protein